MTRTSATVSAVVLLLGVAMLWRGWQGQPDPGAFDLDGFGKLPVVHQGRLKPLDTVARNALRVISDKSEFVDADGVTRPAIVWLADVMSLLHGKDAANEHRVFRVDHDQLVTELGLEPRPGSWRYSISEMQPALEAAYEQAQAASEIDKADRSVYQAKLLELSSHLDLYAALANHQAPLVVPAGRDADGQGNWLNLPQAFHLADQQRLDPALYGAWRGMLTAYARGDVGGFNETLAAYQRTLAGSVPGDLADAGFEWAFNRFAPFYQCSVLMVVVFVLCALGMLTRFRPLVTGAAWLAALALVVWGLALVARMSIQDRPWVFVTNLYSSAVFIGWVIVAFAVAFEAIFRNGLVTLVASGVGFACLVIAHNLAGDGDTLQMMQAVLDTNFWLATHVTTVTIGYAVTYLAGMLGICFIVGGVLTPWVNASVARSLSTMIYATIAFALLFSFVGTVLGGIWADQSWGRFWGWDPKENGALIIVLWNALILHARWGGIVRARGIAVLAVFGNVVTAWSWFGVNMLGVGLHTYADASGARWLLAFVASQLLIMAVGMIPLSQWRSQTTRIPAKRGGSTDGSTGDGPPPLPAR